MLNRMARDDGIEVESVLLYDDIASAPKGKEANRRGMAGMIFGLKIAGALAEQGADIKTVAEKTRKINATARTILVAMSSCTIPTTGQSLFSIADDEFIIGPGQHGEPGPEGPSKIKPAKDVIEDVAGRLIEDGEYKKGDDLLFDKVMLVSQGDAVRVGQPMVDGVVVRGQVVAPVRGDKIIVFKKKRRKGYKKTQGHWQDYYKIRVEAIEA